MLLFIMSIKRALILLIILLIYSCAKNERLKVEFNLSEYDFLISKAENEILQGNFQNALLNYEKAEKNIAFMLSIDLNNALMCATKLKDWKKSIFWSKKFLMKGIKESFFSKVVFSDLRNSVEWNNFKHEISKIEMAFAKNKSQSMINTLDNLSLLDQEEYCLIPSGKTTLSNAFNKTEEINVQLDELIVEYGYPTEESIGVKMENDTTISPLPKYYGLIRHSRQANSNLINKHLQMAVKNGYLKKEILENVDDSNMFNFIQINCQIYEYKYSGENLLKLNNKRVKIIYNNRNNDEGFILYAPIAELVGAKIDDFKNLYVFLDNYSGCENL
jgi:hypothetical protein